ncbi:hypothetical protein XI09_10405 [Bradyrhizobium sp. CCBAU 11386]|uniref:hypothetical protein n=1 Tax=Bradyrhizobium sp. CCBAU 11386 TaxID=1630837 RepID=UPI00230335FC|nr:hypothetical protein [Bradyrhizobium sp. CCBAU 11386]MDA9505093.1 hypothetical protein [Bradyrhizobium sp. CCBAU 11386]
MALLRDLTAKADAGMMLHATHVSPAGELTRAGLAAAKDVERGIQLRAAPAGLPPASAALNRATWAM